MYFAQLVKIPSDTTHQNIEIGYIYLSLKSIQGSSLECIQNKIA